MYNDLVRANHLRNVFNYLKCIFCQYKWTVLENSARSAFVICFGRSGTKYKMMKLLSYVDNSKGVQRESLTRMFSTETKMGEGSSPKALMLLWFLRNLHLTIIVCSHV